MANRRWTSQFSYSFERQPVRLMGSAAQSGSTGTFAAKVTQGITLTAVTMGVGGNSITIAFTAGATAGSEVVSVSGKAISVQIEDGVSSITQVRTAINNSAAAAALVTATGTSASAVAVASALPLLTGTSTAFTQVGLISATVSQIGTGVFMIQLQDSYPALLGASIMLQRAAAVDLIPQIKSVDVLSAQQIVFRMQAAATPTNLADGDVLYISLELRNSNPNPSN